jgi:UDP-N-acetylmuramoyl-tripeptide--D-alanyl-D-alanine ligase
MNIESLYALFLTCSGVCTDTRNITENSMFFALKGANFDANTFAHEALTKGSKYAVIDNAAYSNHPNVILVDNALSTIQQLAGHHRMAINAPVIALTGSNGKTTTKELITQVLKEKYRVHATKGNLNNHIGVPLTLLAMPADTEIAVVEMGANGPNDIAELCEIAHPDFGLITNIGKAHLEGFGDFNGVLRAKGQLYDYIRKTGGQLFINMDDAVLAGIAHNIPVNSYGITSDAAITGKKGPASLFLSFEWTDGIYESGLIQTQLTGDYNLPNFLAAAAIGNYFGVPANKISSALAAYTPDNNRSQIQKSEQNTLILDAYNANPTSTEKALRSFAAIDAPNKFFILGDMLELGTESHREHLAIVQLAYNLKIDGVFVGKLYRAALHEAKLPFKSFENVSEMPDYLGKLHLKEHLILIKGSRGIKLETLVKEL